MRYKIDTREDFDIVTPLYAHFDSILTDQLNELVDDNSENGRSLIIDFSHIEKMSDENIKMIEALHNEMYQHNRSFVVCHLNTKSKEKVAEQGLEHVLNISPTLAEAIDIVSMEGLERELLGEEE